MDLEQLKADTEAIFATIAARNQVPENILLNLQFIRLEDDSDREIFAAKATSLGYKSEWIPDDDDAPDEAGYLEISTFVKLPTAASIWAHDERLTLLAHEHGFAADGWGFMAAEVGPGLS